MADYPTWAETERMIEKSLDGQHSVCRGRFSPIRNWLTTTFFITVLGMSGTAAAFLIGADRDNRESIAVNRELDRAQDSQIREMRRELIEMRRDNKALLEELIKQIREMKQELRYRE